MSAARKTNHILEKRVNQRININQTRIEFATTRGFFSSCFLITDEAKLVTLSLNGASYFRHRENFVVRVDYFHLRVRV